MDEAFWAARKGDALLHSSFMADLIGGVLEIAANIAIGALALGAVAVAAGVAVGTLGCGTVLLVGVVVGVGMAVTGADKFISEWSEKIGNWLAPPTIQGYIASGSPNTRINSKPAARAAATALPRQTIEEMEEQSRAEQEDAERKEKEKSLIDTAGEYLNSAIDLYEKTRTLDGLADIGSGLLSGAGNFISEMWQPTVARAFTGSEPRDTDKIDCHKHPSSFSNFLAQQTNDMMSDPLDFALKHNPFNPLGALETGFQAVNGLLGSAKGLWNSLTGQPEAEVGEYIAEGARDVRINSQPAVPAKPKWLKRLKREKTSLKMCVLVGRYWWCATSKAVNPRLPWLPLLPWPFCGPGVWSANWAVSCRAWLSVLLPKMP